MSYVLGLFPTVYTPITIMMFKVSGIHVPSWANLTPDAYYEPEYCPLAVAQLSDFSHIENNSKPSISISKAKMPKF